jgi:enoyl-CoA hydratase/carnithine racemase
LSLMDLAGEATEVRMANPDVLSTQIEDGIAVVTLGSPKRIYFDPEMSDALLEVLTALANDEAVRVVVVTGGAHGYFVRHYSVAELVKRGEQLQSSGRKWAEDTPYKPGSFASAMRVAEQMPKPVIAAISGSAMGGAFEFTLACDIRVAQLKSAYPRSISAFCRVAAARNAYRELSAQPRR